MATIGISKSKYDTGWYKDYVVIKVKRGYGERPSGGDAWIPTYAATLIAPKALSTWSS